MRNWLITRRRAVIAILALAALASPVVASSVRMYWINHLRSLGLGFSTFHDVYKRFPSDISDSEGKPVLSWRVALLPFIEESSLYMKFRTNDPWDAWINKECVKGNNPYSHPWSAYDSGRTSVVMPRGRGTFWGEGGRRTIADIKGDPARTILLIEVDEGHAPFWSEPRDLIVDPDEPRKGLGWRWQCGFMKERGCSALFADGQVLMISEHISDDQLRCLFSGESTGPLSLNWHQAMFQLPHGWLIAPSLAIAFAASLGGSAVLRKLWLRRPVAPGEFFLLILGVEYFVHFATFIGTYEYELVSSGIWGDASRYKWLALPARIAGCVFCTLALIQLQIVPRWRILFGGLLLFLALATLDAMKPDRSWPEKALLVVPAPFVMAFAGIWAILLTRSEVPEAGPSRRAHWLGVFGCFVPLIWFSIWWFLGYVDYSPIWFQVVRE
jgi:Protein of unknown function (DUF1559)